MNNNVNISSENTRIVLTLKEEYFKFFLSGKKKYEYRFRFPKVNLEAYIYLSSPVKKIVGLIRFKNTKWLTRTAACAFYENHENGCAKIMSEWIGNRIGCYVSELDFIIKFKEEINLNDLQSKYNFLVPQSWSYLKNNSPISNFLLSLKYLNLTETENSQY